MVFSPEFCGLGLSLTGEYSLVAYKNKVKTVFKVFLPPAAQHGGRAGLAQKSAQVSSPQR
jgi:hypothetical protein